MKKLVLMAVLSAFACGSPFAQSCESEAVGKALAGAAKTSFIKKCCEDSAMGKDGKPLAGAAKTSYVKKCESGGYALREFPPNQVEKLSGRKDSCART